MHQVRQQLRQRLAGIKLIIESLDENRAVGSSIVLYLEDNFAEPSSIPAGSVYIVAEGDTDDLGSGETQSVVSRQTGNGSRVYVTSAPKLKTSDYFDGDKKDISIRVLVPDMCTNATNECEGPNGLRSGQMVTVVFESDSGIKNPSEEIVRGGMNGYKTGYAVLGPTDNIPGRTSNPTFTRLNLLPVNAKISLSDVDNSRGYEMTVTGSGFNDGTTARVYVLHIRGSDNSDMAMRNMYLWDALDCPEMVAAVPADAVGNNGMANMSNPYCGFFNPPPGMPTLPSEQMAEVQNLDFSKGYAEMALCDAIVRSGTQAGAALVGSDDKVAVTFEVTAPTFGPGNTNHICMVDGEGRMSDTDVEDFKLEPSIAVVPSSVASGDTVNVFAQDFPKAPAVWSS